MNSGSVKRKRVFLDTRLEGGAAWPERLRPRRGGSVVMLVLIGEGGSGP
jgi:hypothetical protein